MVIDPSDHSCFICRELSWLKFNLRVLEQAADRNVPVLERLKFLGIYYSNLDEFFMVRVGSITHRSEMLPEVTDIKTGWTADTQLKNIFREVRAQQSRAEETYRKIAKALKESGIEIVDFKHISKVDESIAKKIFAEVRPMLSPNIVDSQHPWPFLGNLEEYTAVMLGSDDKAKIGIISHYRLPAFRVYEANDVQKIFVMSELVKHFAPQLFKRYAVKDTVTLRVTRNADIFADDSVNVNSWADDDFRKSMEVMLKKRKRMMPVRLQICGSPSQKMLEILQNKLPINERNIFTSAVPFSISFSSLVKSSPGMKYVPRTPSRNVHLKKGEFFRYLKEHDLMLSFPYQSITPFIDMLYEAADDPDVVSIKITLYRLASSSKLAAALAYAADQGKHVECMLELRARFDEQNNIDYSEMLQEAGCTVFYGLKDYKVHCKVCSIVRKTQSGVEYFTQIGTGNYNEVTSEQYCDLSLITSDESVGKDACALFDALATGEIPDAGSTLLIAPAGFKSRILELMEGQRLLGGDGRISIKVNSLNDYDIMTKLIECSQAGVKIELFIRGICCIRPGIEGLSENITVKSVVGRYLEHSRIFIFGMGKDVVVYMGSGDLLNRNTERRVEVFVPVRTRDTLTDIYTVMRDFRDDSVTGWLMNSDGDYTKDTQAVGGASHDTLYSYFSSRFVDPDPENVPASFMDRLKALFGR
ncbi:MAG: polyphosphate kinase 1 [Eubacteriaceae bacterium]|nr:polyphosphate kinase 1 [Eubacteriaceae bacterium]